MQKGLFACLLLLTACSTTTETEEMASLVALPLSPQAPPTADVLFAKLQKQDEAWQLLSIASKRMSVDLLRGEERVFIQTGTQLVMPDYDHHQYRNAEKRLFDCGQNAGYNKHTTYNPCVSQFSSNTKFGEGWFGWTRRLDVAEINQAIKQTDLLARAKQEMALVNQERQRCLVLRQQAEKIIAKQTLALRVIDQTEMYKQGHELVSYDLNIQPDIPAEGCAQELEKVKLSYDVGLHQEFNLVLELRGKGDWSKLENNKLILQRSVAEADKKLIPTLYITGKKVGRYNLYKTWSNNDVAIDWRTLDITDTDLRQLFDVRNLGQSAIEIQRVSFYINKHVVTQRNHYKLLPQAGKKGLEHASRYFMLDKKIRQHIDAIKTIDKKSEQAEFGIKVSYTVNGESRTLFKTDSLKLTGIL